MVLKFARSVGAAVAMGLIGTGAAFAQQKPLLVAVDTAFVPFEFKQGDTYVGFDIDILDAITKDIGREYRLQPMDFAGILPALQTNNVDVALAGITITEERRKAIDFSDGYYQSGLSLMVPQKSDITGWDDLNGKTIAVRTGTAGADYARETFKDAKLSLFPNIDNAYLELATGRVDAAIHDTPNVLYYIATVGKDRVKTVGGQVEAQQYGIGFPKGSDLVPEFNKALASMKEDGRYNEIYRKWFNTDPPQ